MRTRNVKILLFSINYWPELTGIGKYNGEMAAWLTQQGVALRVVTAPPYYPAWRVDHRYSSWRYHSETADGVRIVRCPLWVPERPGGLKRILHLASFAISSLPVVLWSAWRWRPDVVFVVEPPLFCALPALLAARIARACSWLHVQDFEVDAAFELGLLQSPLLRRGALAFEAWLMKRFTRVTTISEHMLERLTTKGVARERTAMFANWVELDRVYPLDRMSALRREWELENAGIVVLYSGNMGRKQGLEILIDVAREFENRPGVVFVLCGEGVARADLERRADGLTNIRFRPLQPSERLNELLNLADIHVLPQRADAADLVLPSKLSNMLASGRPVVAMAALGTQIAGLVSDCGIVCRPEDSTDLVAALSALVESADLRRELGARARATAERLWDKNELLARAFSDICHEPQTEQGRAGRTGNRS